MGRNNLVVTSNMQTCDLHYSFNAVSNQEQMRLPSCRNSPLPTLPTLAPRDSTVACTASKPAQSKPPLELNGLYMAANQCLEDIVCQYNFTTDPDSDGFGAVEEINKRGEINKQAEVTFETVQIEMNSTILWPVIILLMKDLSTYLLNISA